MSNKNDAAVAPPSRMAVLEAEFFAPGVSAGKRMDLVRGTMDLILEIGAIELEDFLTRVIKGESDPIIRHEAVFVAGALVKYGMLSGNQVFPLIDHGARHERSTVVRHESVEALANFLRPESVATLKLALTDREFDVRATALISLERIAGNIRAAAEVREAAAAALAAAQAERIEMGYLIHDDPSEFLLRDR